MSATTVTQPTKSTKTNAPKTTQHIEIVNDTNGFASMQHHQILLVANSTDSLNQFITSFNSNEACAGYLRTLPVIDGTYKSDFGEFTILLNTFVTADYISNNIHIEAVVADATSPTMVGEITFDVLEPKGVYWLNRFRQAELNLNISTCNMIYTMFLVGVGIDKNGASTLVSANPLNLIMDNITSSFTEVGTMYNFSGFILSVCDLSKSNSSLYNANQAISISCGGTGKLSAMIASLQDQLNYQSSQAFTSVNAVTKKGRKLYYMITVPDSWKTYTISSTTSDNLTENSNTSVQTVPTDKTSSSNTSSNAGNASSLDPSKANTNTNMTPTNTNSSNNSLDPSNTNSKTNYNNSTTPNSPTTTSTSTADCQCETNQNIPTAQQHTVVSAKVNKNDLLFKFNVPVNSQIVNIPIAQSPDTSNKQTTPTNTSCSPCNTSATSDNSTTTTTANTTTTQNPNIGANMIRYPANTDINSILNDILSRSTEITKAFALSVEDIKAKKVYKKFKILNHPSSDSGSNDDNSMTIHFDIVEEAYPIDPDVFQCLLLQYDYMYSGRNMDVLDFSMKMEGSDTIAYLAQSASRTNNANQNNTQNDYATGIKAVSNPSQAANNSNNNQKTTVAPTQPLYTNDVIGPGRQLNDRNLPSLTADQITNRLAFIRSITTAYANNKLACKIQVRGNYSLLQKIVPYINNSHTVPTSTTDVTSYKKWLSENVYNTDNGVQSDYGAFTGPLLCKLNIYTPVSASSNYNESFAPLNNTAKKTKFWWDQYWQVIKINTDITDDRMTHDMEMIIYAGSLFSMEIAE